jgi:hypothetical protein
MRFEALKAVNITFTVFWVDMLCSLLDISVLEEPVASILWDVGTYLSDYVVSHFRTLVPNLQYTHLNIEL